MVCAPVRSIIPELKLGDYLSVQAHKPCSISHRDSVIIFLTCSCVKSDMTVPLVDLRSIGLKQYDSP